MQGKEVKFEFYNDKLLEFRKNKNLSQEELAEKIGVSRQSIYAWESGKSVPDIENMSKLCQILEVKTEDLTNGLTINIGNVDNCNSQENKTSKKIIIKFVLSILLILFLIYLILSIRKLSILNKISSKINHIICYNNYSYEEYCGKREYIVENVNYIYTATEKVKYKDNIVKITRTNIDKDKNMTTQHIWCNRLTGEGYYLDVDKKTYSKFSGTAVTLYDTGYIKYVSENSHISNDWLGRVITAFDPFFNIKDEFLHYALEYKFKMNGYEVKAKDYIFKETGFPYSTWYFSKDNSETFQTHNIEIGTVTDEDVAKPDLTGYTFIEPEEEN